MSIWRALIPVLVLGVAACTEPPATTDTDPDPQASVRDQEIGFPPSCPPGESTIFWTEATGTCGQCVKAGVAGQPQTRYAGCSGDPEGTRKLIQGLCVNPC